MINRIHIHSIFETLLQLPLAAGNNEDTGVWSELEGLPYRKAVDEHLVVYGTSSDFYDDSDHAAYQQAEKAFRDQFAFAVAELVEYWHTPDYHTDHLTEAAWEVHPPGFDHQIYWRGGIALAYWCKGDRLAYVEVEHQDKEDPFMLIFGVRLVTDLQTECGEQR